MFNRNAKAALLLLLVLVAGDVAMPPRVESQEAGQTQEISI